MQEIPGGNCPKSAEERKQLSNYCSECGERLEWVSQEVGVELYQCPHCE